MKRICFIILSLLLLSGCNTENTLEVYTGHTLNITAEIGGGSRTDFVEDQGVIKVEWEENETTLVLLYTENGEQYAFYRVIKNEDGTATLLPYSNNQVINAKEGEKVYAYYGLTWPMAVTFSGTTFSVNVGGYTSSYYNNSELYASGTVRNQQLNLTFKHVYAYLRIGMKQQGVAEVDFVDEIIIEASAKTVTPTQLAFDVANGKWMDDVTTRTDCAWPMKIIHREDGISYFYWAMLPQKDPVIFDFLFSYADGYVCMSPEFSRVSPPDMEAGKVYDLDYTAWNEYQSTDYSQDGEVKILQKSTKGKGIDLVFMGEGFVDKDWNNGIYEGRMKIEMERLFSKEPMKSLRDRFNVYMVNVVSSSAGNQRINGQNGYTVAEEYARKVVGDEGEPRAIIVYNFCSNNKRSFTTFEENYFYAFIRDNDEHVVSHEATGHGIGLLKDEYVVNRSNFPEGNRTFMDENYIKTGRDANVDWRNDPETVRWAHFIKDSRYADEKIGIYDGAYYLKGLYCATENSIMRYGTEFNAPSREAIYKRIMKLSEGESWEYDYETFVEFDAPNWRK